MNALNDYSPYLKPGRYYLDDTRKVFVHSSSIGHPVTANFNFNNIYIEKTMDNVQFNGLILLFSMNGSIKIISDDAVLTFFEDAHQLQNTLDTYCHFSKCFNIPEVIETDTKNNSMIEEYIHFLPDSLPPIETIFNQYLNYFKSIPKETIRYYSLNDLMKNSLNTSKQNEFQTLLDIVPGTLYTLELPFIPLHGDLWRANALTEEGTDEIYYIDWDESGSYLFFYDIFKCMWNEYDVNDFIEYFQSYMNGSYDNDFSKMFSAFSLTYQAEYRAAYFSLFFLNFLLAGGTMPYNIKKKNLQISKGKYSLN